MKIIVNALSGNGDALMFSPSLKLLKEKLPDASIDMLVMFKSVREMYGNNPYISEIHFINFLKQSKLSSLIQIRNLKKNEYDVSINVYPANRIEYNIVNSFLGAKRKISHHYLHTGIMRAEFLNDTLVNEVKDRHNILQNLDLIKQIVNVDDDDAGQMEIFVGDDHIRKAAQWHSEINPGNKNLIGFHPGSSILKNHIHKRWDKNKYARLGKELMNKYNAEVILFGNEFDLNNEIISLMDGKGIIGSTADYMDSISRMKYCKLFISNDTAFMHTAAALQIPVVAIFAYTNHNELHPWKTPHVVVRKDLSCSPCFYNSPAPVHCILTGEDKFKCIETIQVGEVMRAADSLVHPQFS